MTQRVSSEFMGIFGALRPLYSAHADRAVVVHDEASRYYIATHEVRAKDGYRTGFGGVEIMKAYVSAHLMPVYVHPALLEGISPDLRKRMQGKSCFNFKTHDARLFAELDGLIRSGFRQFEQDGRF